MKYRVTFTLAAEFEADSIGDARAIMGRLIPECEHLQVVSHTLISDPDDYGSRTIVSDGPLPNQ